jgi:hypothetical protein
MNKVCGDEHDVVVVVKVSSNSIRLFTITDMLPTPCSAQFAEYITAPRSTSKFASVGLTKFE